MTPLQESTLVEAIMAVRGQIDFSGSSSSRSTSPSSPCSSSTITRSKASMRSRNFSPSPASQPSSGSTAMRWLTLICCSTRCRSSSVGAYGQADRFHPAFYEHFVLASYADATGDGAVNTLLGSSRRPAWRSPRAASFKARTMSQPRLPTRPRSRQPSRHGFSEQATVVASRMSIRPNFGVRHDRRCGSFGSRGFCVTNLSNSTASFVQAYFTRANQICFKHRPER